MYIYVCVYLCACVYVFVCVSAASSWCLMNIAGCVCVYVCVCLFVCMRVYVFVCVSATSSWCLMNSAGSGRRNYFQPTLATPLTCLSSRSFLVCSLPVFVNRHSSVSSGGYRV